MRLSPVRFAQPLLWMSFGSTPLASRSPARSARFAGGALTLWVLASLVLVSLLAGPAFGDEIRRSFDVAPGGLLQLEAEGASVRVTGDGGNQVRVVVTREGSTPIENDFDFVAREDTKGVSIELKKKAGLVRRMWSVRGLKVEVEVPAHYELDVRTSGGSVKVASVDGKATLRTSGGSVSVKEVGGPVVARTSGGSVEVRDVRGGVEIGTSGGSIVAENIAGDLDATTSGGSITATSVVGAVDAQTSGGSVRLTDIGGAVQAGTSGGTVTASFNGQPHSDCSLTSSGGSVVVYLPEGAGFDVDAKASGGRVRSDVQIATRSFERSAVRGQINGGGPRLLLRSSGGGVQILQSE